MTGDQELVERLRKVHAEITESDGGESDLMAMVREAADEIEEIDQLLELQWAAAMRATNLWREAHPGNELVIPDLAKLEIWLLEQVEDLEAAITRRGQAATVAIHEMEACHQATHRGELSEAMSHLATAMEALA